MEKTQELLNWLEKLKSSDKLIIVEGIKDKAALKNIGIQEERIVIINKPAFAIAEYIEKRLTKAKTTEIKTKKQVIILTDLDTEGKKLYANLKRNLSRVGVQTDTYFREFLFKNSKLSHIEGIDTYFNKM
jgi:5S rRNA maturation endonuclease (ribonuclease M5)